MTSITLVCRSANTHHARRLKSRLAWCFFVGSLVSGASLAQPPISLPADSDAVVIRVEPGAAAQPSLKASPSALLAAARRSLDAFRRSADLRDLGDAQHALSSISPNERNGLFFLYRGAVRQSLHQFSLAEDDLRKAAASPDTHRQAWLMLFNIAFVQGDYGAAGVACDKLDAERDLYAASCRAHLRAVKEGEAAVAFSDLKRALAGAALTNLNDSRQWAVVTLADIAERNGDLAVAETYWQLALALEPGHVYSTSRLCDVLVLRGREQAVLAVTKGMLSVDNIALCRAKVLSGQEGAALLASVGDRFEQARWRGEFLNKRGYAEYLLLTDQDHATALKMARENWQFQRELPDARVLRRAEAAVSGKTEAVNH